jgi:hypothetical protein
MASDKKAKARFRGHKEHPTPKQRAAVDAFLAHPGDSSSKNIKRAGYSVPKNVTGVMAAQVTQTIGFQELLNERVPDDKLADLISAGMQAEKPPAGFEDFVPDWGNRFKFVELVTRLKGYGKVDAPTVNVQFTNAIPRPEPIEGEVVENTSL